MSEWHKDETVEDRLASAGMLDPDGNYKGWRLTCMDSQIIDSVCVGEKPREAVMVSDKFLELNELYQKAKQKATENGCVQRNKILQAVYDTVRETFKYSARTDVEKVRDECKIGNDETVALDLFIKKGIGVCRHKALTCGALLEMFKRDNHIRGKPSIDRNYDERGGRKGGHAWCRYTNSEGKVFILDAQLGYYGPLKAPEREDEWDYRRPGELGVGSQNDR